MLNYDREPGTSKSINRRTKLAVLVSSLGLSGLVGMELAQPAGAEAEANPSALIAKINHELLAIQSEVNIESKLKGNKPLTSPNEGLTTRYIMAPNQTNHSHHDLLGISSAKGEKMPLFFTLVINNESSEKQVYQITHGDPNVKKDDPNIINLSYSKGGVIKQFDRLAVNDNLSLPNEVEYVRQPALVAGQFNTFIKRAQALVKLNQ